MNKVKIWKYLKAQGMTDAGVAGLMGNIYAESGLNPKSLQNSYEKRLGYTDATYTAAVDNGTYNNFVRDSAGYGLCQWTYWTRKQALYAFCKAAGASIGDLDAQLRFLMKELRESFKSVLRVLMTTTSVREASDIVLLQFECPKDMSLSVQEKRASYGQKYYDQFAAKKGDAAVMENSPLVTYINLSPNCTKPRNHDIDTITIHCVVGQFTAKQICDLSNFTQYNAKSGSSCNYAVDRDGSIGLCVDEANRSWCSSNKSNDHRAITIEVASDASHPYAVTDAAYKALINLLVDICQRNNIKQLLWKGDKNLVGQVDKQNMTVHRWFANKACPGDYLYSRHGKITEEVNKRLNAQNIEMEDDDMDVVRFKELWSEMRKELQDNDSGKWSEEARQWAISTGLIAGNGTEINGEPNYMWADILTREQFVTVLYRFAKKMGMV